jgi:hypothetical protein
LGISRLPFGSLEKKNHFNVVFIERSKIYYREEGGIFLSNVGHVNVVNPKEIYDLMLVSISLTTYIV